MADEGKNIVAQNLLDLQPTAILEFFQISLKDPKTEKVKSVQAIDQKELEHIIFHKEELLIIG